MPLASIPSPAQAVWYLGPIPLRAYALCIVLGVIVAVWLGERRWRARGGVPGTIVDIAVPAVVWGLIGGRLYHVITDWQIYFGSKAVKEPYEALFIWEGGLGIWGAIALGGFGVWLACRRRGLSLSAVADTLAPGIAFAQAIGRWGNWFNQELFGGPTDLPWGLEIEPGRPGTVEGYTGLYHPTFLYESLWNVALGFLLLWAGKRFALRHGRLFALYVAGYTLGRFWIEGLRTDPVGGVNQAVEFFGLRINQYTALVLFVGALVYFFMTRDKTTPEIVNPESPKHGGVPVAVGAPAAEESAETAAAESTASKPAATESTASKPAAAESTASKPAAAESTASDPGAAEPAAAEAAAPEPESPKPTPSKPAAAETAGTTAGTTAGESTSAETGDSTSKDKEEKPGENPAS
ncbi:prolipoprotein diacylglyceryl transferase [Nonomuraea soli]|uniref:Phosphatidylglycerol--prolipoprotein diacylglyceryl transferase n=1 Tax=Nonomuraea soli TaxID=1032476 RepID=A0A7W0HNG1_9ACTN|nr:prolipoprotein diacylglyceryl transferase [Nonomuraea soli]MBA2889780.1 prolipoprotein diacylglyceryl transferase [Nonomuraea soli]